MATWCVLRIHGLLLRCARCYGDFVLLESVIGNGDNPLAAFALDFEIGFAKFGQELAAFTSYFGRHEFFTQRQGVALKIHLLKRERYGSLANFLQTGINKYDFRCWLH